MFASMMSPVIDRVATMVVAGGGLLLLPGCYAQEEPQPDPTAPAIASLAENPVVSLPPEIADDFPQGPAYALGSYNGVDYYAAHKDTDELGRLLCLIIDPEEDDGPATICGVDSDQLDLMFMNIGPGDHAFVGDGVDTEHFTERGWVKVGTNVWASRAA